VGLVATALVLGLVTGVLSGIFGIGGGVVMVPGLVLLLGYDQKTATGTSLLALLLPVGALAIRRYAQAGHVNVRVGLLLALGIFLGAQFGAQFALGQSNATLRRLFALLLMVLAVRLFVSG
jgi:uncharacterized membrane protein YfcA